jgi:hypothetical protein
VKEVFIRKWHRRMGICLALLIFLQAGTGLLLTVGERIAPDSHAHADAGLSNTEEGHHRDVQDIVTAAERHGIIGEIHHGGGWPGFIYHLVVGFGAIGMVGSGSAIFLKGKARTRRS